MESTRELAHCAKQVPRREVAEFKAVANDDLLLVEENRLTSVLDHNEYLVEIVDDLNEENAMLRRELAKRKRENASLQVAHSDLEFRHENLLHQYALMRSASSPIKVNSKVAATESFAPSLAPVAEHRALAERPWNHREY